LRSCRPEPAMHLVQLLLPLYDNEGRPQDPALFGAVRAELARRFGGLTAYTRAPAEGLWRDEGRGTQRDDIVVLEVMADVLDRIWWGEYRARLERDFRQEVVVVRSHPVETL
jgi:hypothetical protein